MPKTAMQQRDLLDSPDVRWAIITAFAVILVIAGIAVAWIY
jgi:hypothetical protein